MRFCVLTACLLAAPGAASAENAKIVLLEEAEAALPPKYPKAFPRGVLNPAWANDRGLLKQLRRAVRRGRPVVIPAFLAPPVAEALAQQLEGLAAQQDDDDGRGYPFERQTMGPTGRAPRGWKPSGPKPCGAALEDFLEVRTNAFKHHVLVGKEKAKHTAWIQSFRKAMVQPAVRQFWSGLVGLPEWASAYDASWSWFRPGDFLGLHADDSQMRYLSLTIHLVRDRSPADADANGGQLLWCAPDGSEDNVLVEVPDRPHFAKRFNISRNGSSISPGFNVAVVFPVFRNSYHAVAPVVSKGRRASSDDSVAKRFTLQGWFVDPCHFKPPTDSCVQLSMQRLQAWSERWAGKATRAQPPQRFETKTLPDGYFEL